MPLNLAAQVVSHDAERIEDGFKNIEVQRLEVPKPGNGEVLLRVKLRPINPTDLINARGLYPGLKGTTPYTGGSEGVAVVEEGGPGASKFSQGTRVVGAGAGAAASFGCGTWAQFISVPEDAVLEVPEGMPDDVAAQFYVNPATVVGMVDVSKVPKGKYLLHAAAGSSLGRQLIQYARHQDIKTINIVRREDQVQQLKDLGADEVINSAEEDVVARVKEITGGEGAWAALDPIIGDNTSVMLQSVRENGEVRVYGALSGTDIKLNVMDLLITGKWLGGFILKRWLDDSGEAKRRERLQHVLQLLHDGVIKTVSGRSYQLEQVHEAIAAANKEGSTGAKVFLSG